MTLIITALADDAVVQVSDRRITIGGTALARPENKALCVSCGDANFTFAFTGLARLESTPTADWVLDELSGMHASRLTFPEIVEKLRERATNKFRTLRHGRRLGVTFVFAGFGPPGPFASIMSNMEDGEGKWFPAVIDGFATGFFYRNRTRQRKLDIIINGQEGAVPDTVGKIIGHIRRHFLHRSPERRAKILVDLVRRTADHPKVGKYIGKDCTSVIVQSSGLHLAVPPGKCRGNSVCT